MSYLIHLGVKGLKSIFSWLEPLKSSTFPILPLADSLMGEALWPL